MVKSKGCEFGKLLKNDFQNFKEIMIGKTDEILTNQKELFNHQSSRVPLSTLQEMKTQWKIITILTGLVCVCVGIAGTFMVAMIKFGGV